MLAEAVLALNAQTLDLRPCVLVVGLKVVIYNMKYLGLEYYVRS